MNNFVDITSYGAKGDGLSDDTAAINTAAAAAKALGLPLYIPGGRVYAHAGNIIFDEIQVLSPSANLHSLNTTGTNPTNAVILRGNGVSIENLVISSAWVGARTSNNDGAAILIDGAQNFSVIDVAVTGGSGAGILVSGGKFGRVMGCSVSGTLADGIHLTNGSQDCMVTDNIVADTGDDKIAVVSYNTQTAICERIVISDNHVSGGEARGITVIGGRVVSIVDNIIYNIKNSGIRVASESSYNTREVSDVKVSGNTLEKCNTSLQGAAASIYVMGRAGYPASDIDIEGNNIIASQKHGIAITTGDGVPTNTKSIRVANNRIKGDLAAADSGIGIKLYGVDGLDIVGNVIQDFASYGIYSDSNTVAGRLPIHGNTVRNVNTKGVSYVDAIRIAGGTTKPEFVTLFDNVQENGDHTVERFIEVASGVPGAAENNHGDNTQIIINQ